MSRTTEGKCFPVWLEQARLVRHLLYGTQQPWVFLHFHVNSPHGKILTKKEPIRTRGFTSGQICHNYNNDIHGELLVSLPPPPTDPSGNSRFGSYFPIKHFAVASTPLPLGISNNFSWSKYVHVYLLEPHNPVLSNQKILKRLYYQTLVISLTSKLCLLVNQRPS